MLKRICCSVFLFFIVTGQLLAQLPVRATQEIQLLLNEKLSRTPAQKKMDSRLLQFVREKRGQKMIPGVSLDPVKLDADKEGNLELDIQAEVTDNLLSKIESMGGKIISASVQFHSIRTRINPSQAEKLAAFTDISYVEPASIMYLEGDRKGVPFKPAKQIALTKTRASFDVRAKRVQNIIRNYLEKINSAAPFAGPVTSQGDRTHRADDARAAYGYAGQGVRIGVISDSYNSLGGAPADVTNGELPGIGNPIGNTTPVTIIQDVTGGTDEGRAMMQIVHDLAPKAQLFFATANGGQANFANNILTLRNAPNNCDVIIDDVSYSNEPVFYDGIIAEAVNTVTASGAIYFGSAGNAGSLAKGTAGAYEADFNDSGSTIFAGATKAGTVHNFGTVAVPVIGDSITVAGTFYGLHWADAPAASSNDYDLFLISAAGAVKASSTNIQSGTQNPYEEISAPPALVAGDRLVVFKAATAAVRAFHLNTQRGKMKYATNGQTHGHASAAAAFAVAATPAAAPSSSATTVAGPFPNAYSGANQVEGFSSDGPRKIFFNGNGTPITPGNFLFATNGGLIRNKPDIAAADGVSTTIPGSLGNFYGTSAAAPHAGAIAGLLKSANPSLTPAQIRTILTSTTADIEAPGFDNVSGAGILQAFQAMQAVSPTPQATVSLGTITPSEGSFNNNNGVIDPGEVGNLSIRLNNFSTVNAANVTGVLASNTPGVSIVQGTAPYATITGGGNAVNASPFIIAVNSAVACGAAMNFVLTVNFDGGLSPMSFLVSVPVGYKPDGGGIVSALGSVAPTGPGYTAVSGQQTGRLFRGSVASTCAAPIPTLSAPTTTGLRQFDAYTFTNTNLTSQCVTVTMTSANGTALYTAAYNDSGFVASNPSLHYVAEPGPSSGTQTFSFTAPAGKTFTVVVHDVNVLPSSNSTYRLSVSLSNCAVGPQCTPVEIVNATLPAGSTGSPYSQVITASGSSGNYAFTLLGTLPAGLSFTGNILSGTPTQAGSFPIKIAAADLTGCPPDTNTYTFEISGTLPAAIATVRGTPQTTLPLAAFADSLKVLVTDASNNPLPGVKVTFKSPDSGASGTFAGGVSTVSLVTNDSGFVSAPVFTANKTLGAYQVTASVVGIPDAVFNLTNFCPATYIVTTGADSGPGSLREVVNNACQGTVVSFAPYVTSIVLTSGDLVVPKGITIAGPGASKLSISGNNTYRIFNITGDTGVVTISGLTIRDGRPTGGTAGGGGILITGTASSGTVYINNCLITNNNASLTASGYGGAIDNEGGKLVIDHSSIVNNTAVLRGGGIQSQVATATLQVLNSTIAGNIASGTTGLGGGIRTFQATNIFNSTIFGNSSQSGANISKGGDTTYLSNSIVAGGILIGTGGTGPDLNGGGFKSLDYNFIQSLAGSGTFVGVTTNNITGVLPRLMPLANYGGEIPVILPQPSSPVVNAGSPALASGTDQRGYARQAGGIADIGAVETNYASAYSAGNSQVTAVLTPFQAAMQAIVLESSNAVAGVQVFFSAPSTGASGTFPNLSVRDTVLTNSSGIATARTFTANSEIGTYYDTARIGSAFPDIRYELTNTIALPIVLGSFNTSIVDCSAKLEWKTLTETNSRDFAVEYSRDGVNFKELTSIPAKGRSTTMELYRYSHPLSGEGTAYYRLKQTDQTGAFTFSSVLSVSGSCGSPSIVAYPNPVRNKFTLVLPGTEKRLVHIYDALGHQVYEKTMPGGSNEISAAAWIRGVYTITVRDKGDKIFRLKLVKE